MELALDEPAVIDGPRSWRLFGAIDRLEFDFDLPPLPGKLERLGAWFDLLTEAQRVAVVGMAMVFLAASSMYFLGLGSTVLVNRAEAELLAQMPTPEPTLEPTRQPTPTAPPIPTATMPRPTLVLPTSAPLPTPVPPPVLPPLAPAPQSPPQQAQPQTQPLQPQQPRPAIVATDPPAVPTRPRIVATPEPNAGAVRIIATSTRGPSTPSAPAATPPRAAPPAPTAGAPAGAPAKPQAAPTVNIPPAPPGSRPTQPPLFVPSKPSGPAPTPKPGSR